MWKVNGKKKAGLESWSWNDETESAVKKKKERLKIWNRTEKKTTGYSTGQRSGRQRGWWQ